MGGLDTLSREFYEFVSPPIDVVEDTKELVVTIDLPGFQKNRINIIIKDGILEVLATRESMQFKGAIIYQQHRPLKICKKIPLPIAVRAKSGTADYVDGVLTLKIPLADGNRIEID